MSDFIGVTPGFGESIATDRVGGLLHQRVKISIGSDGNARDLTSIEQPVVPNGTELSQSLTVSNVAVKFATFSLGTEYVFFDVQLANVRFTIDGSTPTPTVGHFLSRGSFCVWTVEMASAVKFIRSTDNNATIYASQLISR